MWVWRLRVSPVNKCERDFTALLKVSKPVEHQVRFLKNQSTVQSPSWEANRLSERQEILAFYGHIHNRIQQSRSAVPTLNQRLYRSVSPSLRLPWMVRNIVKSLRWGVVSISPSTQTGGSLHVGCPRFIFQCIRSYPPYLEPIVPFTTWGHAILRWQGPTYHGFDFSYCTIIPIFVFYGRCL
jgi:hypothetical protein